MSDKAPSFAPTTSPDTPTITQQNGASGHSEEHELIDKEQCCFGGEWELVQTILCSKQAAAGSPGKAPHCYPGRQADFLQEPSC